MAPSLWSHSLRATPLPRCYVVAETDPFVCLSASPTSSPGSRRHLSSCLPCIWPQRKQPSLSPETHFLSAADWARCSHLTQAEPIRVSPGEFACSSLDVAGSCKEGSHSLPDRLDVRKAPRLGKKGVKDPEGRSKASWYSPSGHLLLCPRQILGPTSPAGVTHVSYLG